MPELSRFYGIVIKMYFDDHDPPHFHAEYAEDERPIDEACACYTCRNFSRAYLRHLFHAGEMTSGTLNTLHNLHFYLDTMNRIREAIVFRTLEELRQNYRRIFPAQPANSTLEG